MPRTAGERRTKLCQEVTARVGILKGGGKEASFLRVRLRSYLLRLFQGFKG